MNVSFARKFTSPISQVGGNKIRMGIALWAGFVPSPPTKTKS